MRAPDFWAAAAQTSLLSSLLTPLLSPLGWAYGAGVRLRRAGGAAPAGFVGGVRCVVSGAETGFASVEMKRNGFSMSKSTL